MRFVIKEVYPNGSSVMVGGDVYADDGNHLGTRQASLSAISVKAITDDGEMTDGQKKAAIRALVVAQAQSWRLEEAYEATLAVRDLAPKMPITLTFDPAPLPEPVEPEPV